MQLQLAAKYTIVSNYCPKETHLLLKLVSCTEKMCLPTLHYEILGEKEYGQMYLTPEILREETP